MEWVEITAKTVEEARELALDQLGVDDQDAEVEVLEEPRAGLFGRTRGHARVRARVKPTPVRPKVERRDRRRKSEGAKGGSSSGRASTTSPSESDDPVAAAAAAVTTAAGATASADSRNRNRSRGGRGRGGGGSGSGSGSRTNGDGRPADQEPGTPGGEAGASMPELTIDEQAAVVADFLRGLADRFGVAGTETTVERVEEDTIEIRLTGGDLGLLIGPKGQTLQLVQELARTTVQRRGGGIQEGRIRIDIAGYRERRREALSRFTEQVAAQVLESGIQKALEPMNPADRKVVHDTVNGIDGVRTISEGEDARRRVVILPDA
jgi:spoIIIJ-associated protein